MIKTRTFNEITQINMGREIDGRVLYWVSAYLVDGLLIDTGCSHTSEELGNYLQNNPPTKVVNTHYHEDHIGGNKIIRDKLKIDIWAPVSSLPLMKQALPLFPYQEMVWGYPEITEAYPLEESFIKSSHYTFQKIDTPGHSRDHIALVEPSRGWCFSGDLYVSDKPKVIRPEENVREIINSMQKLVALPYQLTLFTSVGKIIENGKESLKSCIHYLTELAQKAKKLESRGFTVQEIRDEIFGGESSLAQLTSGQFSSENLIRSLLLEVNGEEREV